MVHLKGFIVLIHLNILYTTKMFIFKAVFIIRNTTLSQTDSCGGGRGPPLCAPILLILPPVLLLLLLL